jgi:hypothetical protein
MLIDPLGLIEPPVLVEAEIVKVGIVGAAGFGSVKKGTKFTLPKVKSFLKS